MAPHPTISDRPRLMSFSKLRRVASVVGALVAWVSIGVASASPVAACTGGVAFDWAVAHTNGGIVRAQVTSSSVREDLSLDLLITNRRVVQGDPPTSSRINAVAGDPCEQTPDAGETIVLLFDIRGDPVGGRWPFFYVVEGPDALDPTVVSDALENLPATDTASLAAQPSTNLAAPLLPALIAAAVGLVVIFRRLSRTSPR